jgi:antitoxin YefM
MKTVSLTDARDNFQQIIEEVATGAEYLITRSDNPVAAVVAYEEYESLLETFNLLSDESAMAAIAEGQAQARAGQAVGLDRRQVEVALTERAQKDLAELSQDLQDKAHSLIRRLNSEPALGKKLFGKLDAKRSVYVGHARRIVYTLDPVVVIAVPPLHHS